MGPLCHITNPPQTDPPQTEVYSLIPIGTYGTTPLHPSATTLHTQIQATYDVHSKQMNPPPGTQLFFLDRSYDAAGCNGVTLHPERVFTHKHLEEYSPGCTHILSGDFQQRIITTHRNVAHIFTPKQTSPDLAWPFKYIPPDAPRPDYIHHFQRAIRATPTRAATANSH